jgi:hypothetical protein
MKSNAYNNILSFLITMILLLGCMFLMARALIDLNRKADESLELLQEVIERRNDIVKNLLD